MRHFLKFGVLAASVALGAPAQAASVLAQTSQGSYMSNTLGGPAWSTFTATLQARHSLTRTGSFDDLSQLLGHDAVWVDQELGNTLSSTEVSTLQRYVAAGHKAVLIGENDAWQGWNASLMAVVGGSRTDACDWSFGSPSVVHALTAGIASVQNACGSMVDATAGATVLFSNGMAALYKIGNGEALVILDSNWNDNTWSGSAQNLVFAQNVVDWIGAPVPEPAAAALMLLGLGAVSAAARRPRVLAG